MKVPHLWRFLTPLSPPSCRPLLAVSALALALCACSRPETRGHEEPARAEPHPDMATGPRAPIEGPAAESAPANAPGTAPPTAPVEPGQSRAFGKALSPLPKTQLGEVLSHPEQFNGKTILVEGHVRRACSRKGCWMEIATEPTDAAPGCRVTFENYSFFVPTDSPGKMATVEATVQLSRVVASHVAHLESEGGTFKKKNPDGSADEVQLIARGVSLRGG